MLTVMPFVDAKALEQIFRNKVLELLLSKVWKSKSTAWGKD